MRSLKTLCVLFSGESFLALLWMFFTPSQAGNAVFLWLSRERLALTAVSLAIWAVILAASIAVWVSPVFCTRLQSTIDSIVLEHTQPAALLIFLVAVPLLLLAGLLAVILSPQDYASYHIWAPATFHLLRSVVVGTFPLALLTCLMTLESAILISLRHLPLLTSAEAWSISRIGPALLALLMGSLTLFYWLVLVFQLRFFKNNPAWYWALKFVPFTGGDALFVMIAVGLIALIYWLLLRKRHLLVSLVLIFALGWFLQIGVGLMGGGGFATVSDRYFSSYHRSYVQDASRNHSSLLDNIRNYDAIYGTGMFTRTKPPGLMAFYTGLDRLVNGLAPTATDAIRYARLSAFVTYVFPFLAMLMVFAIYAFVRKYVTTATGQLPALAPWLFVLCPNVVLFSLFPDQAIYPFLFLLGVVLTIVVVRRGSLLLGFGLGVFLYAAVFFAFTMLPLYPFVGLYLILNYWFNRRELDIRRQLGIALAIAAGTLVLYFVFRAVLNYDFLPSFSKMVAINHRFDFYLRVGKPPPTAPESLSTRLHQILGALWLNNLDFASAIGYPIYILFVVQGFHILQRLFRGMVWPGDILLSALFISFAILNLAGTAQGEVPRLWLFWVPMVVTLAAIELEPWIDRHPRLMFLLAGAQLITIFLTFHFQDLRM